MPISASPAKAIAAPAICSRRGRSRSTTPANTIVKITCSWAAGTKPDRHPEVEAHEQQPELHDAEQEPEAQHEAPRHPRAADEEDRRHGHQREPQRVEQQRREVVEARRG